ncbi:MAG TPA: hypothetical protein VFK04_05000 [Gemmatimonadaceae bacterium]|nr:hypothetical protein [Gemmatimonadaceae bacterium]
MPQFDHLAELVSVEWGAAAKRRQFLFPALVTLLDRLASDAVRDADVITWGCPVPAFGDPSVARVATLGLNPSNREFVDDRGSELADDVRRFHTLRSLGLASWDDAGVEHLERILEACVDYFAGNPYDRWFRRLDTVVSATGASFYDPASPACHLDLIPYATTCKWTELSARQRACLLDLARDTLGLLLRHSAVRVLILNGYSVISHFQDATGITLQRTEMPDWALPRRSGNHVAGLAFHGRVDTVSGFPLSHELLVLGFNHNLQSSYGVTTAVMRAIRGWVGMVANSAPHSCSAITA